jgi:pSer/pThr/pTyr-binding forkhead associated (FHA) protein
MPEAILTILKFCFLGLLYFFLFRVLRAVNQQLAPAGPGGGRSWLPGAGRRNDGGPFKLRVLEPAGSEVFPLGEEVTIGRAPGCSVPLSDDTFVSQLHARIYVRDGRPFVEDLGSTNGTFVNQTRLTGTMPLNRGDRLQVGQTVMEVTE